jgi:tetratricopeptide (TPR) repeat protein
MSRPSLVETIFFHAQEKQDAVERSEYLDRACGADHALRLQVQALLDAQTQAEDFLTQPAIDRREFDSLKPVATGSEAALTQPWGATPAGAADEPTREGGDKPAALNLPRGETVRYFGDYAIQEELGRGGMGIVYRAIQVSLKRPVALKMIKAGVLADAAELRRFRNEAEAVAMLDHPGIVPVFEVGEHEGQSYFSMKLVEGGNLADRLATMVDKPRAAAILLAETAEAVHHAHMRGILHRDLKPENIMVDAEGQSHITDFGLAKRVEGGLEITASGAIMGTPAYMSPEQANGRRGTITTATDVYGLGAILYALLTGKAPFLGDGLVDMLDAVRTRTPEPPRTLNARTPRDLETICLKCLEKDPRRRYASAQALADDVHAWLDARPISARRVGGGEHAWLWCKRKPVVAGLAASVLLAVVVGTGAVIAVQTRSNRLLSGKNDDLRASNAELDQQRLRALAAEGETKKRADELQKVSDFQSRMLAQVDPAQAGLRLTEEVRSRFEQAIEKAGVPKEERLAQIEAFAGQWGRVNATDAALTLIDGTILRPAVEEIDKQFRDQPIVDAALREALAERYIDLGLYDAARKLLEQALATRRRVFGAEHRDTLESVSQMGRLLLEQGKPGEALPYIREALETGRRVLGGDDPFTLGVVGAMGSFLTDTGKAAEALPYRREALDGWRRTRGEDDPDTLTALHNMANLLRNLGELGEANRSYRDVLAKRRRVLGEDHPSTTGTLNDLGVNLIGQGQDVEAVDCFREVLEKRRRLLGEVHPATLRTLNDLGTTLGRLGKSAEAEALLREALANKRRLLGADHSSTLNSLSNLAVFLIQRGRADEAEPMCLESLERRRRVAGPEHPSTLVATNVLAYLYRNRKEPAKAEPYLRDALAMSRRINGEEHPDTLTYSRNLGKVLLEQGKFDEAEANLRAVVEKGGRALGPEHPISMSAKVDIGDLLVKRIRFAEAAEILASSEPIARRATTLDGQLLLALLLTDLGKARTGLKQYEAAEPGLLEAHAIWAKARGETHQDTRSCKQAIVNLYDQWNAVQPGKGYDTKAIEWKAKLGGA